jgi:hypothetical protein
MGKRYRETKFMFSIEDDDDEAGLIVCIYACQYMALLNLSYRNFKLVFRQIAGHICVVFILDCKLNCWNSNSLVDSE